jgi:hypothetical protein
MTGEYLIWSLIIVSSVILIVFAISIWVNDNRMYCPHCKRFVRYIKWRSSDEPNFRGVNHGGRQCSRCGYKSYDYSNIPSD